MINILICAPSKNHTGGISVWADNIINYYKKENNENIRVKLVKTDRSTFINHNANFIKRLYYGIIDYLPLIINIKNCIKKLKGSTIVHLTSSGSIGLVRDLIVILLCKFYKVKIGVNFHFGRFPNMKKENFIEYIFTLFVIKNSDFVIYLDNLSYNSMKKHNVASYYVTNPISENAIDFFVNSNHLIRNEKSKTFLFAGHVIKSKGIFDVLNVLSKIDEIKLKIIGLVPNDKILSEILKFNNIDSKKNWIKVYGEVDQNILWKEMINSDFFIFPSWTEAFPNVILEAMCMEIPIITTKVGAIQEILSFENEEMCGVCVEPRNNKTLRDEVLKLMNDDRRIKLYKKNAKNKLINNYTVKNTVTNLEYIWKKSLI